MRCTQQDYCHVQTHCYNLQIFWVTDYRALRNVVIMKNGDKATVSYKTVVKKML